MEIVDISYSFKGNLRIVKKSSISYEAYFESLSGVKKKLDLLNFSENIPQYLQHYSHSFLKRIIKIDLSQKSIYFARGLLGGGAFNSKHCKCYCTIECEGKNPGTENEIVSDNLKNNAKEGSIIDENSSQGSSFEQTVNISKAPITVLTQPIEKSEKTCEEEKNEENPESPSANIEEQKQEKISIPRQESKKNDPENTTNQTTFNEKNTSTFNQSHSSKSIQETQNENLEKPKSERNSDDEKKIHEGDHKENLKSKHQRFSSNTSEGINEKTNEEKINSLKESLSLKSIEKIEMEQSKSIKNNPQKTQESFYQSTSSKNFSDPEESKEKIPLIIAKKSNEGPEKIEKNQKKPKSSTEHFSSKTKENSQKINRKESNSENIPKINFHVRNYDGEKILELENSDKFYRNNPGFDNENPDKFYLNNMKFSHHNFNFDVLETKLHFKQLTDSIQGAENQDLCIVYKIPENRNQKIIVQVYHKNIVICDKIHKGLKNCVEKANNPNARTHEKLSVAVENHSCLRIHKNIKTIIENIFNPRIWDNGVVPYEISNELENLYSVNQNNVKMADIIRNAIDTMNKETIINFKERTNEENYVLFNKSDGCNSYVGCMRKPKQIINIANWAKKGTVMHEMMHCLGFSHEHQRADRIKYIILDEKAIEKKYKNDQDRANHNVYIISSYGIGPFDYKSILNYGHGMIKAIEKNKDKDKFIGQMHRLSYLDKMKIIYLYGPSRCTFDVFGNIKYYQECIQCCDCYLYTGYICKECFHKHHKGHMTKIFKYEEVMSKDIKFSCLCGPDHPKIEKNNKGGNIKKINKPELNSRESDQSHKQKKKVVLNIESQTPITCNKGQPDDKKNEEKKDESSYGRSEIISETDEKSKKLRSSESKDSNLDPIEKSHTGDDKKESFDKTNLKNPKSDSMEKSNEFNKQPENKRESEIDDPKSKADSDQEQTFPNLNTAHREDNQEYLQKVKKDEKKIVSSILNNEPENESLSNNHCENFAEPRNTPSSALSPHELKNFKTLNFPKIKKWPKLKISFHIHENLRDKQSSKKNRKISDIIKKSIEIFNSASIVKFEENIENERFSIQFEFSPINSSHVGCMFQSKQPIKIAESVTKGSVLRLLMTCLGFTYEHQRMDRENYITLNKDIIENDFKVINSVADQNIFAFTSFGLGPFDFESILFFPGKYFTALDLKQQKLLGQNKKLSELDKKKIEFLYGKNKCTFDVFGEKPFGQILYKCDNCSKDEDFRMCKGCFKHHNKEHSIGEFYSIFSCDCGKNKNHDKEFIEFTNETVEDSIWGCCSTKLENKEPGDEWRYN